MGDRAKKVEHVLERKGIILDELVSTRIRRE